MCNICCAFTLPPSKIRASYRLLAAKADEERAFLILLNLGFKGLTLVSNGGGIIRYKYKSYDEPRLNHLMGDPKADIKAPNIRYPYGVHGLLAVWPGKSEVLLRNTKTGKEAIELPEALKDVPTIPHAPPPPLAQPTSIPQKTGTENDDSHVPITHISEALHQQYLRCQASPKYRVKFMQDLWIFLNQSKFAGHLRQPNLVLMKGSAAAKMRVRGYWEPSTWSLKIHPQIFNATQNFFVEIFLHEMCVSGDALIPTDVGLVRMDEIEKKGARRVLTRKGEADIKKWWCTGRKQTYKISTESGNSIRLTDNHPLLVLNEDCKFAWRRVDELKIGDNLVSRFGSTTFVSKENLAYAMISQKNLGYLKTTTPKFPKIMTPELARLLGYLAAEGSFVGKGKNINTLEFSNSDPCVLKDFVHCWKACFGYEPSVQKYKDKMCTRVYSGRKDLAAWIQAVGFKKGLAPTKRVPHSILEASSMHQAEFVKAFMEGDGSIDAQGRYSVTSSSKGLLRDLKIVLLNMGLLSTLENKSAKGTFNESGRYYRLRLHDPVSALKVVGAISKRRLRIIAKAKRYHASKTQRQLGKHWKIPNAGRWVVDKGTHVRVLQDGSVYPEGIQSILSELTGKSLKQARNLLGDFVFESVRSIEKGKEELVYDMTTSKGQFVANGLVVHNCHEAVSQHWSELSPEERQDDRRHKGHGTAWAKWMRHVGLNPLRFDPNEASTYMDEQEKAQNEERNAKWKESKDAADALGLRLATHLKLGDPVIVRRMDGLRRGYLVCQVKKAQNEWAVLPFDTVENYVPGQALTWNINRAATIYVDPEGRSKALDLDFLDASGRIIKFYQDKKDAAAAKREFNKMRRSDDY